MIYETNYRNTRMASALAAMLVLMGVAFLFGFLFIGFGSGGTGGIDGSEDFNWSLIAVFVPVFGGSFVSIIAAISAQRRKQEAAFSVQKQQSEMKIEQKAQERAHTHADRDEKPVFVYCKYCGERIVREAIFCPQCGINMKSLR